MENICEKYAVYSHDGSKFNLCVTVDTLPQAQEELNKLKASSSKAKIDKAKVKDFGQPGESVVSSEQVEVWSNDAGQGQKLSDVSGTGTQTPPASTVGAVPPVEPVQQPLPTEPVAIQQSDEEKIKEERINEWMKFYTLNGSVIGLSYNLEDDRIIKEPKTKEEKKESIQEKFQKGGSVLSDWKEKWAKAVDSDQYIEKWTNTEDKMFDLFSVSDTKLLFNDLKDAGAYGIGVNNEDKSLFFSTGSGTDYKKLMKAVIALNPNGLIEHNDVYVLFWN